MLVVAALTVVYFVALTLAAKYSPSIEEWIKTRFFS
jgi:hypothetical protein